MAQFKRGEWEEIQINVLQITHTQMYIQIVILAIFSFQWEGEFFKITKQLSFLQGVFCGNTQFNATVLEKWTLKFAT